MTKSSRKPFAVPLAMSTAPADTTQSSSAKPQPSPLPHRRLSESEDCKPEQGSATDSDKDIPVKSERKPVPKPRFPSPKLCLECRDLSHPGAKDFFANADPSCCLSQAVETVLSILYIATKTNNHIPPTRSVTLVLRAMDGVAYTTGIELDNDHKQIHFSCDYIASRKSELKAREIMGVLVHEMVHAWQWNGQDQAPGGLIEGIADFVRLKAGLDPPHWKREQAEKWDQGYQHTAYFLEWIETKYGQGSVRRINDGLKDAKYDEGDFWRGLFESSVNDLWEKYKAYLEDTLPGKRSESDQENIEPSMEDTKFWNLVREREGGEKSVVMKAIWRTNRHNPEGSDREIGSIGEQLDSLWSEYLKARLES